MVVAIVTTLRNPPALESFVRYHLAVGFDHLFLFFDDPDDRQAWEFMFRPKITVVRHTEDLRRWWRRTRTYTKFDYLRRYIDQEAMARQILNAGVAIELALEKNIDWLLHIDADELFYNFSPGELHDHFREHDMYGHRIVFYPNFEAVPEKTDINDCFQEVDLFKKNRRCLPGEIFTEKQQRLIRSVPQLAERFFNFYTIGKCAARVSEDLLPEGVHGFSLPRLTGSPFYCRRQVILHYPVCGFEQFWNKYQTLGRFNDSWFGKTQIRDIEPFHLEARDIVLAGRRDAAREFYKNRVVIDDQQVINRLIAGGVLTRIADPSMILHKNRPDRIRPGER